MAVNERVEVSGYTIEFKGIKNVEGPNYSAQQGQISVYKDGSFVSLLKPERRSYRVQTMGMTEAGIDPGLFRDVYVALGDPLEGGAWAIRVHYKPFVRWIWLGAILMVIGGVCAMFDKRYRKKSKQVTSNKSAANNPQEKLITFEEVPAGENS
jgi:cytochrome c-type biogenesis protein CcmF